jgi:hypothetical protein
VAFVILQLYNGQYKRLANEVLKQPLLGPDSENGMSGMGLSIGAASGRADNGDSKSNGNGGKGDLRFTPGADGALVRVTSLDSGGSGNGNSGIIIGELSVANNSLNLWNVSRLVVILILLDNDVWIRIVIEIFCEVFFLNKWSCSFNLHLFFFYYICIELRGAEFFFQRQKRPNIQRRAKLFRYEQQHSQHWYRYGYRGQFKQPRSPG